MGEGGRKAPGEGPLRKHPPAQMSKNKKLLRVFMRLYPTFSVLGGLHIGRRLCLPAGFAPAPRPFPAFSSILNFEFGIFNLLPPLPPFK
jgi:hypothetical protein